MRNVIVNVSTTLPAVIAAASIVSGAAGRERSSTANAHALAVRIPLPY